MKRILLMDDDEIILSAMSKLINTLGYEVTTCHSGEAAFDLYTKSLNENVPYDISILDYTVSVGMNGVETLHAIRELNPEAVVILASGQFDNDDKLNLSHAGFNAVIAKPFFLEDLQNLLVSLLP